MTGPMGVRRGGMPVEETTYRPGDGRPVTEAVVNVLATVEGCEPTALPPLQEYVDVDVLNELFDQIEPGTGHTKRLHFVYAGWEVIVHDDGSILVCEPDELQAEE